MQKNGIPAVSGDVPSLPSWAHRAEHEVSDDDVSPTKKEEVAREAAELVAQQKRLSVRDLASKFERGQAAAQAAAAQVAAEHATHVSFPIHLPFGLAPLWLLLHRMLRRASANLARGERETGLDVDCRGGSRSSRPYFCLHRSSMPPTPPFSLARNVWNASHFLWALLSLAPVLISEERRPPALPARKYMLRPWGTEPRDYRGHTRKLSTAYDRVRVINEGPRCGGPNGEIRNSKAGSRNLFWSWIVSSLDRGLLLLMLQYVRFVWCNGLL